MNNRRQSGFTLIELLVVVAIIALLVGFLLPSLSKARELSKRTRCQANLRSIGQAIRMYMDDNYGFYPPMAHFRELDQGLLNPRMLMAEILKPYMGGQNEVFHCPSDRIVNPGSDPAKPADKDTYFEWQGSSYDPVIGLSTNSSTGKWDLSQESRFLTELQNRLRDIGMVVDIEDMTKIAIVHDYEAFHGGNRMALYADFHVTLLGGK